MSGIDDSRVKSILIIKIGAIGDVVRAFPALVAVAEEFPGARIDFMISDRLTELLEPCPYVTEIIPYDKKKYTDDWRAFLGLCRDIRNRRYDMVLNLQNTKRYQVMSRLSGARYRSKIITLERPTKGIEGVFKVLETVGMRPHERFYEFWFTDDDLKFAIKFLRAEGLTDGRKLIGIAPGAGWPSKQWPLKKYVELSDELHKATGGAVIVFGSASEVRRGEEIKKKASAPVAIASGRTTIRQAAALIEKCSVFISNDSGLMHVADLLQVPTVGIFGSTNPAYHGPSMPGNRGLFRGNECSPCYKPECKLDFDRYYCLTSLGVDEAFEAAMRIIR